MNQLQIHNVKKITMQTRKIKSNTRSSGYFYSIEITARDTEGKDIRFNLLSDEALPMQILPSD